MANKMRKLLALGITGLVVFTGCGNTQTANNSVSTEVVDTELTTSEDGEKQQVAEENIESEPLRIVSGTVAATQVLDQLEVDLVGVPTTSQTLPERYAGLEEIGMAMNPDLEKVVALEPDLFILDANFKESLEESIANYGINTFYLNTSNYDTFMETIDALGEATGKDKEAEALIEEIRVIETEIAHKAEVQEAPTVAVLFGANENFMLATGSSYVGNLVETVGAENIANKLADNVESSYVQFSLEKIVEQNPDYILRFAHGNIEDTKAAFDNAFTSNPAWQTLDAVKEDRVIDLDSSIFNVSANIRVKEAITILGNLFYGE